MSLFLPLFQAARESRRKSEGRKVRVQHLLSLACLLRCGNEYIDDESIQQQRSRLRAMLQGPPTRLDNAHCRDNHLAPSPRLLRSL